MRVLVLQHISCEPPGLYEDILAERGAEFWRVELDEGETLPDWRNFDAIIAMGGPMSVNDDAELPWLSDEKRLIAEAVRAGRGYWGACLGSQLLAASLGARVYPGAQPEVGIMPVRLTQDAATDPVFRDLPDEIPVFQWHGDTFDLPAGATLLAGSAVCPNQAFRWGSSAYGLQYHLEISSEMVRDWARVPAYAESLDSVRGPGSFPALIQEIDACISTLGEQGRLMFERWLDLAAGASPVSATHQQAQSR